MEHAWADLDLEKVMRGKQGRLVQPLAAESVRHHLRRHVWVAKEQQCRRWAGRREDLLHGYARGQSRPGGPPCLEHWKTGPPTDTIT